ncbi:hypothetical protein C8Q77DRAFT_758987 [Trametes polyzona]|nr:hypothetical protein C8Q77DRAFT_758987 [Trametes polyzona]
MAMRLPLGAQAWRAAHTTHERREPFLRVSARGLGWLGCGHAYSHRGARETLRPSFAPSGCRRPSSLKLQCRTLGSLRAAQSCPSLGFSVSRAPCAVRPPPQPPTATPISFRLAAAAAVCKALHRQNGRPERYLRRPRASGDYACGAASLRGGATSLSLSIGVPGARESPPRSGGLHLRRAQARSLPPISLQARLEPSAVLARRASIDQYCIEYRTVISNTKAGGSLAHTCTRVAYARVLSLRYRPFAGWVCARTRVGDDVWMSTSRLLDGLVCEASWDAEYSCARGLLRVHSVRARCLWCIRHNRAGAAPLRGFGDEVACTLIRSTPALAPAHPRPSHVSKTSTTQATFVSTPSTRPVSAPHSHTRCARTLR